MNKDYHRSMKTNVIFASLFLGVVLFTTTYNVTAQSSSLIDRNRIRRTPSPDVYQEYIYNLNLFYNDRKKYETDRTKYVAYKTVQSRETALKSSVYMLESARTSLLAYAEFTQKALEEQTDVNSRVKEAILADIETHKTFLTETSATIDSIATLEQSTQVSGALQLRYTYMKVTIGQALLYIDVAKAKNRNDKMREIVKDFQSLMSGYPEGNENKVIITKWAEEIIPELADNEIKLNEILETGYPEAANEKKPIFEGDALIDVKKLAVVNSRLLQYIEKLKEINLVAKEAYKEL